MKSIAIMDTSVMSFNHGDQIIMESCERALTDIVKDAFVVYMPTHSPLFRETEFRLFRKNTLARSLDMFDLKLICGTNALGKNRFRRTNNWNMRISDTRHFSDFVLVGVGTDGLPKIENHYTRKFYDLALSHRFVHSVRDAKTKAVLEELGFQALDTGCTTLWPLTKEHCEAIPIQKGERVIFTLTAHRKNLSADTNMIDVLCSNYKEVFFWPQGIFDDMYFEKIKGNREITKVPPSLKAYDEFLSQIECDYVGTRLHGGIKAMQKGHRSLVIGVDNRARDMAETHNVNVLERTDLFKLEEMIRGDIITDIKIDHDSIKEFLGQFQEG